ncbi:plasmid mobilization protein [Pseudovibrio ascidiaceicola]|uniref:plasmid mobilization protein n=1 Tax=Pseudovibrio ascidiaceicola TaxID=285279 RepID=UPI003D35A2EC
MSSSESRKSSESISFRVTPEEQAKIKAYGAAANPDGHTAWVRNLALEGSDQPLRPRSKQRRADDIAKVVRPLISQINKLGNNLNQLTKVANSQRYVDKEVRKNIGSIEAELRTISTIVREAVRDK